jgi:hypothetical protein
MQRTPNEGWPPGFAGLAIESEPHSARQRTPKVAALGLAALLLCSAGCASKTTRIGDPEAFVAGVYRRLATLQTTPDAPVLEPTDIYTPRLEALFAEDRRQAGNQIGCIDFDIWTNDNAGDVESPRVTSRGKSASPDRRVVVASFFHTSGGSKEPQELQFDFHKIGEYWLVDEVHSLKDPRWTLSELLKCK